MHDLASYVISNELEGESLYSVWPCEGAARHSGCGPVVSRVLPRLKKEVVTPLRWKAWDYFLVSHPDQEYCKYIVTGLWEGLRIGFKYNRLKDCKKAISKMVSTTQKPKIVRDYLSKEYEEDWVQGPLPPKCFQVYKSAGLG